MNIKNFIESIGLEKIKVNSIEKIEDYEVITIEGGLNGTGTLDYYLDQVKIIEEELTGLCSEKWLISWVNDCLDDVWTLKLGVRQYENLNSESSNENSTVEIYNDKDELMRHNAELVNREEIITQSIRSISENLSLIMKGEPESFIGGDIALSTVVKVMESLGWKFCTYDGFDTNGWDIDYWLYFIKDEKDFSYRVSGNVYFGGVKIEKCEKHYEK